MTKNNIFQPKWNGGGHLDSVTPTKWELLVCKIYSMIPASCAHSRVSPIWRYTRIAFLSIFHLPNIHKILNHINSQEINEDITSEIDAQILKDILTHKEYFDEPL